MRKINTINKLKSNQCRYYDSCSAPLCPFNSEHLKNGLWYPDEEICRLKGITNWIKQQKKIAKKTKDKDTYYNYQMLSHNCRIGKGMTGLNPDKPEEPQLEDWLKKHPSKKALSEKQKNNLTEARKKRQTIKV